MGCQPRKPVRQRVPEGKGSVHVRLDLLRIVGELGQSLLHNLLFDAFDGAAPDEDGGHGLGRPQRLANDCINGGIHVPLEDLQDRLSGLGPPHNVLQHLLRSDEVSTDHGSHLVGDLLLPLQEHALEIDVAATNNVRFDWAKDHRYAQPICEVADDQARHWQDDESTPAPETVAVAGVIAIKLPPAVQQQPEDHLNDAQQEAHDGSNVLNEDKLPLPNVFEHGDKQTLVVYKHVDGHLLDVNYLVHVGLQILYDGAEHCLTLLQGLLLELVLHHVWQLGPELRAMLRREPGQNCCTGGTKGRVQAREEVLWLDTVDDLLDGDEAPDHDVTASARHDVSTSRHNALPTQYRLAAADKLNRVEHHLNPEPYMPPSKANRHHRDGEVLEKVLPTRGTPNAQ
mmetsp:Transcript_18968/g.53483  ORF Transcript_18968/g.53483 Transcript_18968/m.53483 type:complete len:398 (+) Transcript_18968:259-1452(+)